MRWTQEGGKPGFPRLLQIQVRAGGQATAGVCCRAEDETGVFTVGGVEDSDVGLPDSQVGMASRP